MASSGGIDSCVLFNLLLKNNFTFGVAHFNFKLRALASDVDELFVKKYCTENNISFHSTSAETETYAKERKISIQMAARELRYSWFEKLRKEYKYELVLTAHHQDDNLETILLNITKGTGLKGLRGILPKKNFLVRPMLCLTKEQIIEYAYTNNLKWRDDTSNATTKYERNKIRHEVVPVLKEINKTILQQLIKNSQVLAETEQIYNYGIEKIKKEIIENDFEEQFIAINKLTKYKGYKSILFEILNPFGFNITQVNDIINAFKSQSGKKFLSESHQVIKDRKYIILAPINLTSKTHHLIKIKDEKVFLENATISINLETFKEKFTSEAFENYISKDNFKVKLHYNKIKFPLKLRHWKKGDYFYPFGMNKKKKKVSEFFKNQKLNLIEKDKVWILEDNQKRIVWLIGYRIDDRFAINKTTKKVLEMNFVALLANNT